MQKYYCYFSFLLIQIYTASKRYYVLTLKKMDDSRISSCECMQWFTWWCQHRIADGWPPLSQLGWMTCVSWDSWQHYRSDRIYHVYLSFRISELEVPGTNCHEQKQDFQQWPLGPKKKKCSSLLVSHFSKWHFFKIMEFPFVQLYMCKYTCKISTHFRHLI